MLTRLTSLWNDEDALTTVEYALLLSLVAVAGILAWSTLGNNVESTATNAADDLVQAGS